MSWTEARLVSIQKTVKGYQITFRSDDDPAHVDTVTLAEQPPLRNTTLNENRLDNLTELTHLNEPSVLKTIRERYLEDDIYTYSGIVLVSVNPYRKLDLYSNELILTFDGRSRAELEPHLFAVAEEAYRSLSKETRSQSIVVSGESGAGKTISAKYIMRYLAEVCKRGPDIGSTESKILATNPILEAFGNAKTVRNDNSSRFGKYVQILFNAQHQIVGAQIKTFLLEKTRVVSHAAGERNYHIFYQFLAGLSRADLTALGLGSDGSAYAYLDSQVVDGVSDAEEFELTRKSLALAGFSEEAQWSLWVVLAAILHIGNIEIGLDAQDYAVVSPSDPSLLEASRLLQIDSATFMKWLCKKLLKAGQEEVETRLSRSQAVATRDSVARHLYGLLFSQIISSLNAVLRPEKLVQAMRFIGILDIYGFEKFDRNSFEQFCINYANERLQFQFNQQVFKLEQALYESEGICWSFINFNDNQPCIDMIEGKQGVLRMLAEECRVPNGSDRQLAEKINGRFDETLLCRSKFDRDTQFTVKHFAYDVSYEIDGFLDKNRDSFPPEQLELLRSSGSAFVSSLFDGIDEEAPPSRSGSHDAVGRDTEKNTGLAFKASLNDLMDVMDQTQTHYIRCIKPNQLKEPLSFDSPFVVQQLRACGIIETIRISAAGFPGRWLFADFCTRYRVLHPSERLDGSAAAVQKILGAVALYDGDYQVGRTRVFLRAGVLGRLEDERSATITNAAVAIESNVRAFLQRSAYKKNIAAIGLLQAAGRMLLSKAVFQNLRMEKAASTIATSFKRWACMFQALNARSGSSCITAAWRMHTHKGRFAEHQMGSMATCLTCAFRGFRERQKQHSVRASATVISSACKMLAAKRTCKGLRAESRSIARLLETSSALERKIMDLAARMQTVEVERDTLRDELDASVERSTELGARLTETLDETSHLEDQISMLQDELEALRSEQADKIQGLKQTLQIERERSTALEDQLREALSKAESYRASLVRQRREGLEAERPPMERTMSTAMLLQQHDDAQREAPLSSRRHLRKLSMDSKLDHVSELQLPHLESVRQHAVPLASNREDLLQILNDPRLVEELHDMIHGLAGFDPRREQPSAFLRLPSKILEHWIATWLDLDPEPLSLGDHFHNLLGAIKNLCLRSLKSNEGPLTTDQKCAFWIANLVQLLGFLQHRITALSSVPDCEALVVPHDQQMTTPLVVLLQMRTKAARTVEELYRAWLSELCSWFATVGPAAIMDHQGLVGYSAAPDRPASRFLSSLLGRRPSNPQLGTDALIDAFDVLIVAMQSSEIQSEIAEQLLGSVLSHVASIAFNELLVRKSYATWRRGIQIQYNLSQLEDWATRLRSAHPAWLPVGPPLPQTEPLLQAVKLLQLAKSATTEDIPVIQEACPVLNTAQIRRILSLYIPDEFESGPVCQSLMRALALRCQHEELAGFAANLMLPEVRPDTEPLHLSIKPVMPSRRSRLPAASVPPTLWKLFVLAEAGGGSS